MQPSEETIGRRLAWGRGGGGGSDGGGDIMTEEGTSVRRTMIKVQVLLGLDVPWC